MTSRRLLTRVGSVLAILLASVAQSSGSHPVAAADWTPTAPPQEYDPSAGPNAVQRRDFITAVCATDADLDCVESIAAYIGGAWVEGEVNLQNTSPTSTLWTIEGVTSLDGSNTLSVTHLVNYTGNLFLQTTINSSGADGDHDDKSLPRGMKFRATVRTSWVLPTHVAGKMSDASIKVEKLSTSGASRVTMEGTPIVFMVVGEDNQSSLTDPNGRGDYEVRQLSMTVSDGRFYPIKQNCIEKPTIMVTENGYGNPLPTFKNGALDLQVTAPHFLSDGVTEHIGIYEATVPLETAKCLWGDTIGEDSTFEVKVVGTDGTNKEATTSVDVENDMVTIRASGFTFSSPTVRVSYTPPAAPTTPPSGSAPSSSSSSTSSSTTSSTTTSTTTAPAPVGPAKPKAVKIAKTATGATVGFARAKGVSYRVVAAKGAARKSLKCKLSKTKVSCSGTGLAKGSWTVTVTPRQAGVTGTPATVKLKIV